MLRIGMMSEDGGGDVTWVWRFEMEVTNPSKRDSKGKKIEGETEIMRFLTKRDMRKFVRMFKNYDDGNWVDIDTHYRFWEDGDLQNVALVKFGEFGWDNSTFASGRFPQAKVKNLEFVKLDGEELEAWKKAKMDEISERVAGGGGGAAVP